MKKFLMAGVASMVLASGAMAQIGSPSQTSPGGPPATSAQPPQNTQVPIGSAPGVNSARGTMGTTDARRRDSMTAGTQSQRPRAARQQRMNESDRAYMGGGAIFENGVPIGGTSGMMNDRGTGAGMTGGGRNADPSGMGSSRMPGGTGTGRGAGSTTGG